MCKINQKIIDKDRITGYKFAVKHEGKYYSPYDGRIYDGEVGKVNSLDDVESLDFYSPLVAIIYWCYNPKHDGKTAAYLKPPQLSTYTYEYAGIDNVVLVECELSGELYDGLYMGRKLVLGTHIKVIRELEYEVSD